MSLDNKAIVRRLYEEVWNKRRLDVVDQLSPRAMHSATPSCRVRRSVQSCTSSG